MAGERRSDRAAQDLEGISTMNAPIALVSCLLVLACPASPGAPPPRSSPPGPHVHKADPEALSRNAFPADRPIVGTYYFQLAPGAPGIDPLPSRGALVVGSS